MKLVLLTINLLIVVTCRKGFGPTEQEWGYVTVREGAHLFWWLHQTSANVDSYTERPLVIWLQGGPGASSTGYGNFAELGPLDADLNPRNTTWIQYVNVLYVDNPVGSGYSYTDSLDALPINNTQIAEDFVVLLRGIFNIIPDLKNMPMYIFCESYGGKMAVEIALAVNQAVKNGSLEANLKGLGLGDSWISPIDSVLTWAPYLLNLGIVDQNEYEQIQVSAEATKKALDRGNFSEATSLWSSTEALVKLVTNNVDFYNVLSQTPSQQGIRIFVFKNTEILIQTFTVLGKSPHYLLTAEEDEKINTLMNGVVKEALHLNHSWGFQSAFVFIYLREDFMKPVTDIVEILLNTTNIKIGVYNGQLDLIVDTPGTIKWVDNLEFKDSILWKTSERSAMIVDNIVEGYYKKLGNLAVYWVNRAGHMVSIDNPSAMYYILNDVTEGFSNK
ncbi:retinoid-inducible serine carboxypeptidase-like isoform X1 [Zophobas morio]|uniref:retinoid-inducible serine carboxypeptidase-like isoform X1 n=1 Tax=Zophobas morio TaxID=2755281 RepID=UPI0030836984